MALPSLSKLDSNNTTNGIKRGLSLNAPEIVAKRRFFGDEYEVIANRGIRTFAPHIFNCQETDVKTFDYYFWGKNRLSANGNMKITFNMQLDEATFRTTNRAYALTFRIYDEYGEIDASTFMLTNGVPEEYRIYCRYTTDETRAQITTAMYLWLDFTSTYFGMKQ